MSLFEVGNGDLDVARMSLLPSLTGYCPLTIVSSQAK